MSHSMLLWCTAASIILGAGTLQGLTGFGYALIASPFLMMIYDIHTVVIINIILGCFAQLGISFRVKKDTLKPVVKQLLIGSLLGIPIGSYILFHFDIQLLKLGIGLFIIAFSLILLSGFSIPFRDGNFTKKAVGFTSGLLTASIGLGGPPIILFLTSLKLSKSVFRATSSSYFALMYLFNLCLLLINGSLNIHIIQLSLSLIPFIILGNFIGMNLFQYIPQKQFKQGVIILVLVAGFQALYACY